MQITINNKSIEVQNGETIIETARRMGYSIPSLCYAKDAQHKSSCMVCAVKNDANGQIIPSCTTLPTEGMQIDTESDEIKQIRALSLELLLSDHRADCEAPCHLVCPVSLDIELMLSYYDKKEFEKAHAVIAAAFSLPEIACDTCKAPCEKACRRGRIDKAVAIRTIIKEIAEMFIGKTTNDFGIKVEKTDKNAFQSRLSSFTTEEKKRLEETVVVPSLCLHCACTGRKGCMLRQYATEAGIKRSRYEASSKLPIMTKQHVNGNIYFEQAKCIRCGLCVYNTKNGFTFKDRGFGMEVVLPEESRENIGKEVVELCPTGAIYLNNMYI
ncbi:MAG: (2Fe-2S)-binding protein [Dysgonamonadaceae bacterium]|jgi:predicted molibdopterin-dependent oxidoreductase YjgC|nr:(2Fe-2S)-binding protein [Dysgonamonadaceae bacterium]